jgi:DNA-binding LytR/AlgR family response regulator
VASNDLHFTMRELQHHLRSTLLWGALAGVSVVLGLAGPFGTYSALPVMPRLAYWGTVVVVTYLLCIAVIAGLERVKPIRGSIIAYVLYGAVSGLPIAVFVWLFNQLVFARSSLGFWPLVAYATVIAAVGSAVISTFTRSLAAETAPSIEPAAARRPTLLDRLPLEVRGRITHLSVQDHYVEVRTEKGRHLILMRLSDAIAETDGIDGMQVHRSHWVARSAVQRTTRRAGRLYLRLHDGEEIPVSRSYMKTVREAELG